MILSTSKSIRHTTRVSRKALISESIFILVVLLVQEISNILAIMFGPETWLYPKSQFRKGRGDTQQSELSNQYIR